MLFLSDFNEKLNFLGRFSKKSSNIKFNENSSSGSRVVSCARTDGQPGMMKLKVVFCNLANAPKTEFVQSPKVFSRLCDTLLQERLHHKVDRNVFLQFVFQSSGIPSFYDI